MIISIIFFTLAAVMLIGFAVWMKRTEDAAKKSDVENTRNIDFASGNPL